LSQAYRQAGREEDARREQAEFIKLKDSAHAVPGTGPIPK